MKRPRIKATVNGLSLDLRLTFQRCLPTQKKGRAIWMLVDCDCRANFKVAIGDMEIQPRIICKVILSARNSKGRLYLARQAARKSVLGEALPP